MSMHLTNGDARDSLASSAPTSSSAPGGLSIDDWDCLLAAVTARLRAAVADAPAHLPNGAGSTLQASVLECADALGQLLETLRRTGSDAAPDSVNSVEVDRGAQAPP